MRIVILMFASIVLASTQFAAAQTLSAQQTSEAVDGLQMAINQNGTIKPDVPNLQITFSNVSDHDLTILLGIIGGHSPRPCKLDGRDVSCTLNFKLNVTDRANNTRTYDFKGIVYVAGRIDPYIVYLRSHSTYTLELGIDQFWSPASRQVEVALPPGTLRLSVDFEGRAPGHISPNQPEAKLTFWKGKLSSNSLTINVAK